MPIDVQCTACGQRLRVGDALAGKQANCPKCKAKVTIPTAAPSNEIAKAAAANQAASSALKAQVGGMRVATATPAASAAPVSAPATAASAPPDEWHLQTSDGQRYGPISKAELDTWLAENRITVDSQLLPPGGQQWVAAQQIYPSLVQVMQQSVAQQPVMHPQAPQFPAIAPAQIAAAPSMPSFPPPTPAFAPNPYAAPMTSGSPTFETGDEIGSLANTRRLLMETRPWALFIAIVGFIYGAFVILMGIMYVGVALMALGAPGGAVAAAVTGIMALAQLAFGSLIIYAFVCLTSYAMRIGEFQRSTNVRSLESALRAQRSFWRIAGIILAIILALMMLGLVLLFAGYFSLTSQMPSRF